MNSFLRQYDDTSRLYDGPCEHRCSCPMMEKYTQVCKERDELRAQLAQIRDFVERVKKEAL